MKYVDSVLEDGDFCLREAKEEIEDKDRKKTIEACEKKVPLVKVARKCGWMVLWDRVLERGWKHTKCLQAFSRLIGDKGRGERQCPYCKNGVPDETLLWTHFVMDHEKENSIIDEIAAGDTGPAGQLIHSGIYLTNSHIYYYFYACSMLGVFTINFSTLTKTV